MKQLIAFFILGFALSSHAQDPNARLTRNQLNELDMIYKATYSGNFQIGNTQLARIVLNLWKDYDNNVFKNLELMVADTVTGIMPDGTVLKGNTNLIKAIKDFRGGLADAKSTVDAYVTLRSPDHPDDMILTIWGSEVDTKKDGTKTSMDLQEVWIFNKDAQLRFWRQFSSPSPKN
jgi:hypothetical protein